MSKNDVCFESSAKHVLAEVAEDYRNKNQLTASSLLKLRCAFGATFERALELYESMKVTEFKIEVIKPKKNNRAVDCFYEVKGQSSRVYTIFPYFPNINFCSCLAFENQVLKERSTYTCKHILAVWLASLTQTNLDHQTIKETEFREVLLGRVKHN